jgi:hypothetical protein
MRFDSLITSATIEDPLGIGLVSHRPRCYDFRLAYRNCIANSKLPMVECHIYREDLLECLFHKKEVLSLN